MDGYYTRVICPILCCCCLLFSACTSSTSTPAHPTHTIPPTRTPSPPPTPTATPSATSTTPARYTTRTLLQGIGRPDDLLFDQQGQILFSDPYNGTVNRLHSDGTVSVLLRGLGAPEGLVLLTNGTLVVAEQHTNRILAFPPGSTTPTILRTLPGIPSSARCKDGVDNIALDPTNNTLIIPDSPTGVIYRMSTDGQTLTQLATGLSRPVGAIVDAQGSIYVADECGGAIWRIAPNGTTSTLGGFQMPDDVALDQHGNLYVIDLAPAIHALIRVNLATGQHETLASQGFIEPQGLLIDAQDDHIFVSDDYANEIREFSPAS